MSRNLKIVKDISERKYFSCIEIDKIFLKFFMRQATLNFFFKQFIYVKFLKKINLKGREYSRYRNICLCTNKMRFVFRYFRLSRMVLKNYSSYGYLVGVFKSSW